MNERVIKNPNFKNNGEFHKSLATRPAGTKGWPNTHTEVEYLGGGKFAASIGVGHRVFFDKADGNKPKKHKLTDERPGKDYVLIQGAKCCVEVYPYYAKYFDVQHEEVRLYEERWVVQRLFKEPDEWLGVDAYNPQIAVEEYSEPAGDVAKVTVTYDTDYGILTVEYFQRDGNALKHNVTFQNTSGSTETFRVLQRWAGIVGNKLNGKNVAGKMVVQAPAFTFGDDAVPFKICESVGAVRQEGVKDILEMFTASRKPVVKENVLVDKDNLKLVAQDIYTYLELDGEVVMDSSEHTLSTLIRATEDCPTDARVFMGGLGLGAILFPMTRSHKVKEVIICEKDSRVIDAIAPLVEEWFGRRYPNLILTIMQGDAIVEVAKHGKFDWIFMDIDIDGLEQVCVPYLTERGVYTCWLDQGIRGATDRVSYFEPVDVDIHPQGLKSDFIYSNWILAQNESLVIDPDTATLNNPTVDGYIAKTNSTYSRDTTDIRIRFHYYDDRVNLIYRRGYSEWNINSIDDAATISKVEFRYEGLWHQYNSSIYAMANQPSVQDNDNAGNQVIWDDAGDGTAYLIDNLAFPEIGNNKDVGGATGPAWNTDPKTDVEAALAGDWFAFGFKHHDETSAATVSASSDIKTEEGTDPTPPPTLYVEYTPAVTPDPPTNVQATDGIFPDKVRISWTKSPGATGYQVYRDGTPLGWLGDVATFDDPGAGAPSITKGTVTATGGTYIDKVRLDALGYDANNGATHAYKVRARNVAGESVDSGTNTGYRRPGTLYRQWQRSEGDSDDSYSDISGAISDPYDYTGAPAPTITPGNAAASDGLYIPHVALSLSGQSANVGAGRYYRAKYTATGCTTQYTSGNRGYRGVGDLTYQWQRSEADSDANYSNISGATTASYNDTGAPADGSGRYYRCVENATGAAQQISAVNRGYRQPPVAPTSTTQAVSTIKATTAKGNGEVTATGGENCDKRGVCWKTSSGPTVADSKSEETGSFGTGAFTRSMIGLSPGTKYYVKAYAHNSAGYGYGNEVTFTTKPKVATGFSAAAIDENQIDASWTAGTGATKTMVRRKVGSYPTSVSDGEQAYFGIGASFSDTSLDPDTHYFYRAWSWVEGSDIWSDDYAEDDASTPAEPPEPPEPPPPPEAVPEYQKRALVVGGVDVGPDNPLPVDTSPGPKVATTVLDEATIDADTTTVLGDCDAIDLSGGEHTLALTVEATYNGAATQGIKIHVRTSYDGTNFDNIDWDSFAPSFTAGATIRQTKHYDVSPYAIKVLVENLDPAEAVTAVKIIATVGP